MGDIAEMMVEGALCQVCGEFIGDEVGYPRTCSGCQRIPELYPPLAKNKVCCPTCGKRVKETGLADHQRDVHGVSTERKA
jgi:rRNA maturation endonuclease Nob1